MPQSAIPATDPVPAPLAGGASFTPSCHGLLELFLAVSDGRSDQGRDHPVAVVLALVAAATVAGSKGYTAMTGWGANVPAKILDSLYTRVDARPGGRPSRSTINCTCCPRWPGHHIRARQASWSPRHRPTAPRPPNRPPPAPCCKPSIYGR